MALYQAEDRFDTVVSAGQPVTVTTAPVNVYLDSVPSEVPGVITFNAGSSNTPGTLDAVEEMGYNAIGANYVTVNVRGMGGTTPTTHSAGASVRGMVASVHINQVVDLLEGTTSGAVLTSPEVNGGTINGVSIVTISGTDNTNVRQALVLNNTGTGAGTGSAIEFYHGASLSNKNARIYAEGTATDEGDLYMQVANGTNWEDAVHLDGSDGSQTFSKGSLVYMVNSDGGSILIYNRIGGHLFSTRVDGTLGYHSLGMGQYYKDDDIGCYIDMYADTVNAYSSRIMRISGETGELRIYNLGGGDIQFRTDQGTVVTIDEDGVIECGGEEVLNRTARKWGTGLDNATQTISLPSDWSGIKQVQVRAFDTGYYSTGSDVNGTGGACIDMNLSSGAVVENMIKIVEITSTNASCDFVEGLAATAVDLDWNAGGDNIEWQMDIIGF